MGVFAGYESMERVCHHGTGDITGYRNAIALANSLNTIIRGEANNDPERSADYLPEAL